MGHVIEYNDIIIESLLFEIIGTKNLAGYDLSWNFTEVMMKFGFLRELGEIHLYIPEERPITALQTPDSDWSLFWYIEMNSPSSLRTTKFSGMTVCIHYPHCKISSPLTWRRVIFFALYELSITTIFYMMRFSCEY